MSLLQRLLLLPLLSPLLAVLLLGAFNPRPWLALRLLTWSSPALPLGVWIGGAAAVGAALSAAGTGLALQQGGSQRQRRQVRWPGAEEGPWPEERQHVATRPSTNGNTKPSASVWAGPSRNASDPPPTVSVPFRVVRQGRTAAGHSAEPDAVSASTGMADDWMLNNAEDW